MLEKISDADLTLDTGTTVIRPVKSVRDLGVRSTVSWQWRPHLESSLLLLSSASQNSPGSPARRARCGSTAGFNIYFIATRLLQLTIVSSAGVNYSASAACDERSGSNRNEFVAARPRETSVEAATLAAGWAKKITYKLCLFMHYIDIGLAPKYPSDCVSTFSTASGRYRLRSAGPAFHVLPRTSTGFGECGFFYSGPVAWNTLPSNFQDIIDTSTFRKRLKSVLFDRDQTDYCWCSWTCRIAAPYNSRVDWLIDCGLGYWADTTFHITYLLAFFYYLEVCIRVSQIL